MKHTRARGELRLIPPEPPEVLARREAIDHVIAVQGEALEHIAETMRAWADDRPKREALIAQIEREKAERSRADVLRRLDRVHELVAAAVRSTKDHQAAHALRNALVILEDVQDDVRERLDVREGA